MGHIEVDEFAAVIAGQADVRINRRLVGVQYCPFAHWCQQCLCFDVLGILPQGGKKCGAFLPYSFYANSSMAMLAHPSPDLRNRLGRSQEAAPGTSTPATETAARASEPWCVIHDPGCSIPGIVCAEHCPRAASHGPRGAFEGARVIRTWGLHWDWLERDPDLAQNRQCGYPNL